MIRKINGTNFLWKITSYNFVQLICLSVAFYALYLFSNMLYRHYGIIKSPYQLAYIEVASILDIKALTQGLNPYAVENQLELEASYGVGYSMVCIPLTKMFGFNLFSTQKIIY